ncbi:MAG TPA: serine--tRNA ligase [Chitinophagaceae bacterium]|nr:serine--tRNA ligase [Chitinophagaceae bacterium]
MLQVNFIKNNRQEIIERLAIKNFTDIPLIDLIVQLDSERKSLQFEHDEIQSKINVASREIGELMLKGNKSLAEEKKVEVAKFKSLIEPLIARLQIVEKDLKSDLLSLPNLPHKSVPAGKTPEENEVVRKTGDVPKLYKGAVPHWELAKKYDLIDFELGNKVTGSGFPFYKNKGARLQRALIQYFLDYNVAAGYTEYQPPFMVNEASAFGTGQLPDKEGQMYFVNEDSLFLIPTAEVPITNIFRNEIVKENNLPLKMTAYTPCFRREAGSYGKDVRGLNRVHQFDKVEIVQIVHPEKSYDVIEEMALHIEKLLQNLELPYRILRLCGGDMSFTSALTYDFEVYSAAQEKWLEVSSVSNFETFQSNRMKIRFKNIEGKTHLVHTLNGSSLALPRIVAALLENNQDKNGINLPGALHSYFGSDKIN